MSRRPLVAVVFIFFATLGVGGWLVRRGVATPSATPARITSAQGQRLLGDVMRYIRDKWVDTVAADDMFRRAALGMVRELGDPNTSYLPPDRLKRLREATTGMYTGIGASIDTREGWIAVIATRPGSPAERAGVRTGDRISEVEGQSVHGWTVDEARTALRGPVGSQLKLSIERGGNRIPLIIERGEVHTSSVSRAMMLDEQVGYLAITGFSDSTAIETSATVDSLVKAGATSLLMDLRGNPGGLLTQGVAVADLFLDVGQKIVSTRGRSVAASTVFNDKGAQRWPSLPVVLLVNNFTASAAEIVAGALQDHDRAVVMGRPTYGKGSAQAVMQLADGGALKVTNALWFTPVGRSIDHPHARREVDVTADTAKPRYKTDNGRVVLGGGGIIPDVPAGDSTVSLAERAWVAAVGTKVPQFRLALKDYAAELTRRHAAATDEFVVTPEMRDGLLTRLHARGLDVSRDVFNDAHEAIDRVIGAEVALQAFGVLGAQHRAVHNDPVIARASKLVANAGAPPALFKRVVAQSKDGVRK